MDEVQPGVLEMAAVHSRAEDLARRTVEYHRVREAEHRSRERFGRRFTPFPWRESAAAVLADEALEDESTVVALIRELGRQGCSEVAMAALDLVVTRGSLSTTKAMFDAAIGVCAAEYQDQRCLEQYGRMQSLGLTPDLGTANLVLTALCCRGKLAAAVALLADVRAQLGLRPNSYSVLMVLQACNYKRRGAYREAIDAVQALEAGGRTANEEVIEALLQVCEAAMHRAPSFEAAVAVFQALSELHLADSTRVYNGLLGAAGRAGRWREAQALYVQMQEDDVPASLETHTALIQACVVGRALDRALDIFEHLVAGRSAHEAVPASIATYNHLIHACHQAGMLEKALEIAAWVQKTGVEFDDETYGELMATIDVAQLWDDKAMKQARQRHKAVLPRHLRPAPYDAMRVMYLDHLESLQQEELLALEKLGGMGSWAPKSLTRGGTAAAAAGARGSSSPPVASSLSSSARSLARTVPSAVSIGAFTTAWGAAIAAGGGGAMYDASAAAAVSGYGRTVSPSRTQRRPLRPSANGRETAAAAAVRVSTSSPLVPPPPPPVEGGSDSSGGGSTARSRPPSRSASPQPGTAVAAARAASVRQLLQSLSTRPLPSLGGGAGGVSFRAAGARAAPAPGPPTGFHEPPTWAQVQTLDAATAGPGGTPFSAAVAAAAAGGAGADGSGAGGGTLTETSVISLTLALEPANLYGQASAASLGGGGTTARTSVRSITIGVNSGGGAASLPPLSEPISPGGFAGSPPTGTRSANSGGGAAAIGSSTAAGSSLAFGRQRTRKATVGGAGEYGQGQGQAQAQAQAQGLAPAGSLLIGAGVSEFLPSPLPSIAAVPAAAAAAAMGVHNRRSSLAPLAAAGLGARAAAGAGW